MSFTIMSLLQIKPDPVAKKEYFSQAFCESETPSPKTEESDENSDSEESDDSDED